MPRNLHIVPSDLDTLRADILDVVNRLVDLIDEQDARIAALEAGQDAGHRAVDFASSRPSWSVKQLATDLSVHPNTILNWLSMPSDHPRHLDSFQPGGTGPHLILPEHVADWLSRNQQESAA